MVKNKQELRQRHIEIAHTALADMTDLLDKMRIAARTVSRRVGRLSADVSALEQDRDNFLGSGYEFVRIVQDMSEVMGQLVIAFSLIVESLNSNGVGEMEADTAEHSEPEAPE